MLFLTFDNVPYFDFRFQYEIQPFVQSLPELLHHQARVVAMIQKQLVSAPPGELGCYFHLVAVLARYCLR